MKVTELGHVVLYVRDAVRSARFYRDVLGWTQVTSGPMASFPVAAFSSGRTHHELLLIEVGADAAPVPPGRRLGLYHFGLKIGETDDDLRAEPASRSWAPATTASPTASTSPTLTATRSSCTSTSQASTGPTQPCGPPPSAHSSCRYRTTARSGPSRAKS